MDTKQFLLEKIFSEIDLAQPVKLLDLGSGQSRNFIPFLEKYPTIQYVGVEPSKNDADTARELLRSYGDRARVVHSLAYDQPVVGEFDLCISLSVLEHVAQLERFLQTSVRSVKTSGRIIHLYDLGHALYPSSFKEKIQIFLGNNFPKVLPEHKFVRYLDEKEVVTLLKKHGATTEKITYHQMPNHKTFLRYFQGVSDIERQLQREILDWEHRVSPLLHTMDQNIREKLFPTICIEATRNV